MSEEEKQAPGIEITTSKGISMQSSEWMSTVIGNKSDVTLGNYFSVAFPCTNKIYASEYTQYYPGYKLDVIYKTDKYEGWKNTFTGWSDDFYLRRFKTAQSELKLSQSKVEA